jgi:hypothetical protein
MKLANRLIIERIKNLFDRLDYQEQVDLIQSLKLKSKNYDVGFKVSKRLLKDNHAEHLRLHTKVFSNQKRAAK